VTISVVLPFRNAAPWIAQQLDALVAQNYGGHWEVVAVDNASADESRAIAERFRGRIEIKIVDAAEKANLSYARNLGARAATGDKLIFLDADDEVAPGYLAAIAAAFEAHDFLTPRLESSSLNPGWARLAHGSPHDTELHDFAGFMPFAGGGIAVSRSVFESVKGFNEELAGAEDIAFSWDVQLAGTPLHFVSEAVLRYRHRDSLLGLYRQTRAWGCALPRLYRQYRPLGMPGRPLAAVLHEWAGILRDTGRVRTKADLAPLFVRLGYCVGQLKGSLRHRVLYL
jgi:glycosyltransferase involved in cell wall biosynthesis